MTEGRRRIPINQNDTGNEQEVGRPSAEPPEDRRPAGEPDTRGAWDGPAGRSGGGPSDEAAESAYAGENEQAAVRGGEAPLGPAPADQDEPILADPLAALAAERDAYLDNLLRLKAEFENYRKRSRREMEEVESRARGALLLEFLPVLDNLSRALDAAEHHEEGKVLDGVRMTHGQFLALLRKEGVSEICPLGEPFNPELHEAMIFQPSDQPEGTVTAVLDRGYMLGDRVLRAARVAVSAGPA